MPIDYTKYPPNWKQIRVAIMARAGNCCECTGQCGAGHYIYGLPSARCNAPHDTRIIRDPSEKSRWWHAEDAPVGQLAPHERKVIRVTLTIAHLCQNSACGDQMHLRALCQYCHLKLDKDQHIRNASRTRRLQREQQGQMILIPEEPVSTTPP